MTNHMRTVAVLSLAAATLVACGDIVDTSETDGVDSIAFAPTTAAADGASIIALTIVDTIAPPSDRKVGLTTSVGTFLGGTATISVALNDSGRAYAQIRSPGSAGTAIVTATTVNVTRYFQIPFTAAPVAISKGVTKLTTSTSIASADGATIVVLTAEVDTVARPTPFAVTFSTTLGVVLGGTSATTILVPVNDSGIARAQLRAPADSSVAIVSASAGGITRNASILFTPALPTAVQIAGDFSVKSGAANSAAVSAQLVRAFGTPSPGVTVKFTADTIRGTGGTFGQFSPRTVLSASSTVTTRFSAADTSYRGPVIVRVQATRGATTVSDSAVVIVIPP